MMSLNQRKLFLMLVVECIDVAAPFFVTCKMQAGDSYVWANAAGFIHLMDVEEPTAQDTVFVSADNNVTLMKIQLPWNEIRAAKVLPPTFSGNALVQTLRLYRCREYLSARDIFTNEPKFWFDDTEPVLDITIGGFFSESLRNFVAKFPEESNVHLGDLASNA
ncbi:MAG: hypothetical protein K2Y22_06030 [Candidatus Obscuribacterales bacterium]|nr:hypothetical protein [Candidatus Obscuribacterales bacterium]